jgi:uncharacterized membrane protein
VNFIKNKNIFFLIILLFLALLVSVNIFAENISQDNNYNNNYNNNNNDIENQISNKQDFDYIKKSKEFNIENYDINYKINKNGSINVIEEIDYILIGNFTELFIQRPLDLNIIDYSGVCINKENCKFIHRTYNSDKIQELILKSNFYNEKVKAKFEYTILNEIYELKDGFQFYYQLYGNKTNVPTNLNINLEIPLDFNKTEYFLHSINNNYNLSITKNKLSFQKNVESNEFIEINIIFPKITDQNIFLDSKNINQTKIESTKDDAIKDTSNYNNKKKIYYILPYLYYILAFSPLWAAFLIWFLFGKDKKAENIRYFNFYEREPPNNSDPIEAHYFLRGCFAKNWISTIIMYLVWKKYLTINKDYKNNNYDINNNSNNINNIENDINDINNDINNITKNITKEIKDTDISFIRTSKIFNEKDFNQYSNIFFKDFCKEFLESLEKVMVNSKINLKLIKSKLSKYDNSLAYDFYYIKNKYTKLYSSYFEKQKYLKNNYNFLLLFIFFIIPILGFIILSYDIYYFGAIKKNLILIIYYIISIIIIIIAQKVISKKYGNYSFFGKWNDKGRLLNLKWNNFNKYIQDFSLIKEHPPASIIIWEYYLIFATCFGSAEKCIKALSLNKDIAIPYSLQEVNLLSIELSEIPSNSSSSSSSGFGGGSGGGGCGAR